jgi:hypothetical protein
MSSAGFNLNIYNYGKKELEELLSIQQPYGNDDISASCAQLRDRLFSDRTKNENDKGRINGFLEQVKIRLIKDYMPQNTVAVRPNKHYSQIQNTNSLMISPDVSALGPTQYKQTNFAPTFPIAKAPENLNPLKKRIIRRTLNIDTRFRDNYYTTEATNIHLNLPTVIKNAITMKLVGCEFPPCSIYAINKRYGNNFFHITIDDTTTWQLITVDDGNYTGIEMVMKINNLIAATPLAGNVTCEINDSSCRIFFIFKNDIAAGDCRLAFNRTNVSTGSTVDAATNLQLKLGFILGFTLGEYQSSSINPEFVGEAPYDGTGPKYLYLVVDDFNNNVNNYFIGAFNESILNPNILARLPQYSRSNMSNAMLSDDVNDMATTERNYFGPINVQKLKIQLLDEFGRIVSLNNRDFSLALEFDCVYN